MKAILMAALAACALNGCAIFSGEISGSPGGFKITNQTIVTDLQSAAYNLDQAVVVGALTADDPGPKCVHDFLVKAGVEAPAGGAVPGSFTPKHDGLASAGAIAYILAQQAKHATGQPVSANCEALVGRIVLDGANAARKSVPSLIPGLLR
jgi:hypothetical protein